MLKIGEFSKLAQVSPKALRLYDERGLLQPAWVDRWTGYRYYTADQLATMHRILALKDLGFSLDEIGALLAGEMDPQALARMMRERQEAISRHITAEEARLQRVEARLQQIERADTLPGHDVVLKAVRPLNVAGMRRNLPGQQALPDLLHDFRRELRRQHLSLPIAVIGIYYDEAFQERGLDVEVAAPLTGQQQESGTLTVHKLPGQELMACTVHHGSYARLSEAYEAVFNWLEGNGYQATGPNRDLFLAVPRPGEAQDEAVTEVQIPVRPKPFLSAVAKLKDKKEMKPKIVNQPAFTVVGLPYFGKNENQEIPEMWTSLNVRYGEIPFKTEIAYGLCEAMGPDGRFRYLAGFGVSQMDDVPEGMEAWDVPEETYAVFPCELSNIHETYQYAFDAWLPAQADYQYKKGSMDFEYYPPEFDTSTGEVTLYIYIPVEKT